jgi:hypothetical protein
MATIRDKLGHWPSGPSPTTVKVSSPSTEKRKLDGKGDSVPWSPESVTTPVVFGLFCDPPVAYPALTEGETSSELPPDCDRQPPAR